MQTKLSTQGAENLHSLTADVSVSLRLQDGLELAWSFQMATEAVHGVDKMQHMLHQLWVGALLVVIVVVCYIYSQPIFSGTAQCHTSLSCQQIMLFVYWYTTHIA